jgi:hypothetical protein
LLPAQLLLLQEERRLDQRVTFLARLAAYRPAAVDRVPPALVRLVELASRAVVALERQAELVHPQLAVRSAAAVAAVGQAVAAAEQTRSMR